MGKHVNEMRNKDREGETKVLFKRSNVTICTQSRTCSGASQVLFSKSCILQLKKNLENNHHYYTDGGKVKRDLSIETDICILRRYYKRKRNKYSFQGSSAKSKYSTVVDDEVETIEEFPDNSACGDNEITDIKPNPPVNVASLMIDNLKELLNQWIQQHLQENKETKQRIDTVLDTLIQKLDAQKIVESSSASTYVVHRETINQEVKNKKIATASLSSHDYKQKARSAKGASSINISKKGSSHLTIPFQYKDVRIISTLSIPRSFQKRGLHEKKKRQDSYKVKKIKHKNIILSIDRSKKLINSSSYDLLTISTKSLSRKLYTNDINVKKKKRHIVFFPKPFYKSATDTSSSTNNDHIKINDVEIHKYHLDRMPSLLKSVYDNDPAIITNIDKYIQSDIKTDNFTMTEKLLSKELLRNQIKLNSSEPKENAKVVPSKNKTENIEFRNGNEPKRLNNTKPRKNKIFLKYKKTFNRGKINKRKRYFGNKLPLHYKSTTCHGIQNKQFTFLYKKANKQMSQGKDFLKHCQDILEYLAKYDRTKSIKFDVHINVFPTYENRTKDEYTNISNPDSGIYNNKESPNLLYIVQPAETNATIEMEEESLRDPTENENISYEYSPEIIPLLDGAVSQAKYIFDANSKDKIEENFKSNTPIERSGFTAELEIVQEISELRAVIKDLAAAAEKFVSEQFGRQCIKSNAETSISQNISHNSTSSSKCEAVINLRNPSKGIQYSKDFRQNQKLQSGFKITKEPKKRDTFDYYNRLAKKSTSYRIIDSESLLKVTDMTSKANELNDFRATDEALMCSLPKSKSLFELSSNQKNKRKLIALYCEGGCINPQPVPKCQVVCDLCDNKKWVLPWDGFNWGKKGKPVIPSCCQKQPKSCPPTPRKSCTCNTGSENSCLIPIPATGQYSSACFQVANDGVSCMDEEESIFRKSCKERRGMGFGEGCIYCMLLWIPVLIIACLFYGYVLKDKVKFPEKAKVVGRMGPGVIKSNQISTNDIGPHRIGPIKRNASVLYVKLSDLGF